MYYRSVRVEASVKLNRSLKHLPRAILMNLLFDLNCIDISSLTMIFPSFIRELLPLTTIDHSLGRLDYALLSDQALMEMLFDGMEPGYKQAFQDANGNYKDICEWGVPNWSKDGRMVKISLVSMFFTQKQFPFACIPPLVTDFGVYDCRISGTLDASVLPIELEVINVGRNSLHGTLDFKALPRSLTFIVITANSFSGSCVLADLPDALTHFYAGFNKFTGEISFNALPECLEEIYLHSNNLRGSISIEKIPETLLVINIGDNAFTGDFQMLSSPRNIKQIQITGNRWSGTIVFSQDSGPMPFSLISDPATAVLDDNGNPHSWEQEILGKHSSESEN